jgi:hypothetical protein
MPSCICSRCCGEVRKIVVPQDKPQKARRHRRCSAALNQIWGRRCCADDQWLYPAMAQAGFKACREAVEIRGTAHRAGTGAIYLGRPWIGSRMRRTLHRVPLARPQTTRDDGAEAVRVGQGSFHAAENRQRRVSKNRNKAAPPLPSPLRMQGSA